MVRRMENLMADGFQISVGQEDGEFDGRLFQVSSVRRMENLMAEVFR